jgi:hypothetical protein
MLYKPDGLPYVLERHEQMLRQIADAREEIAFLTEKMELAAAGAETRKLNLRKNRPCSMHSKAC